MAERETLGLRVDADATNRDHPGHQSLPLSHLHKAFRNFNSAFVSHGSNIAHNRAIGSIRFGPRQLSQPVSSGFDQDLYLKELRPRPALPPTAPRFDVRLQNPSASSNNRVSSVNEFPPPSHSFYRHL